MIQVEIIKKDIQSIIESLGEEFNKLKGKTVVVTGANGIVGSYFVHTFAHLNKTKFNNNPIQCICLVRHRVRKSSRLGYLLNDINIFFKTTDVSKTIPKIKKIDYIIHCASYGSPKAYMAMPLETMDANTLGTKNLLELTKKQNNCTFMFVSTGSIYGDARKGEGPFIEEHSGYVSPIETRAIYSESKRFGETLCMVYAKYFNVHATIARLSNMFGPGADLTDGRAIPDFFNQAFNTSSIKINGDPKTTRAYIYISDAIAGMFRILLLGKKGEVFNVANEMEYSMQTIAETICSFFKSCKVVFAQDSNKKYLKGSPVHSVVSSAKLRKMLGWKAEVSLKDGLKRTYLWYVSNDL